MGDNKSRYVLGLGNYYGDAKNAFRVGALANMDFIQIGYGFYSYNDQKAGCKAFLATGGKYKVLVFVIDPIHNSHQVFG